MRHVLERINREFQNVYNLRRTVDVGAGGAGTTVPDIINSGLGW
jgi:hypothetical protein